MRIPTANIVCSRRTRGLGHLLGVEHQVAVGAERARLPIFVPSPHARVRVQAEAEVVLDQVLAADPQVQWVPDMQFEHLMLSRIINAG